MVSGAAAVAFTPAAGRSVSAVSWSTTTYAPDPDGVWRLPVDTTAYADGPSPLGLSVYWSDSFGVSHGRSFYVPVVVDNASGSPGVVSRVGGVDQSFSPDGDGQEDAGRGAPAVDDHRQSLDIRGPQALGGRLDAQGEAVLVAQCQVR